MGIIKHMVNYAVNNAAKDVSGIKKKTLEGARRMGKMMQSRNKTIKDDNQFKAESTFEMKTMSCPRCGATMKEGYGIDSYTCDYCGTAVILNQDAQTVDSRLKVRKQAHKEKIVDKFTTYMDEDREAERKEKEEWKKQEPKLMWGGIIVMVLCFMMLFHLSSKEENKIKTEEANLQVVLEEIQSDILNKDYDAALVKTSELYYSGTGSETEKEEKWNSIREDLVKQITDLKTEKNGSK